MTPTSSTPRMSEQPTTTLHVWPTADQKRFFCTCPFHGHHPPVIFRDEDPEVVGQACALHVEVEHGWKVIGTQVMS